MAGDGDCEPGKFAARSMGMIARFWRASTRWFDLPVGYLSLLSVGLWIVVATFDVPRTAPLIQQIWPLIGAVMLTSGFDSAFDHACRCLPSLRSRLRAVSAGAAIVLVITFIFIAGNRASGSWFNAYAGAFLGMLWKTRRR